MAWPAIGAAAVGVAGGALLGGGQGASTGSSFFPGRKRLGTGIKGFLDQDPRGFFPDQTFADQSPFTQLGIQGLGNFSTQPSQDLLQQTLAGDFLGQSQQVQQSLLDPATQATNSAFSQLGRFGSQANANETSAAGIRALLPLFEAERGRQQQAAQLLPLAQQTQFQNQLQGGALQEQFQQQGINEAQQRFNFDPGLNQLNQILPAIQVGQGGQLTQNAGSGSPLSGALGGGLLGLQLAQGFGGGNNNAGLLANSQTPLIGNIGGNGLGAITNQQTNGLGAFRF